MNNEIKPNKASEKGKKEQVQEMFDGIAASYDKTNHFISLGLDGLWKKRLVNLVLKANPQRVLDLATGTGDLPIRLAQKGVTDITGIDISAKMLEQGQQRVTKLQLADIIDLQQVDSESLPYLNETYDAVTVAYGLRNFAHLEKGLQEAYRVLKPQGVFVILETSVPRYFPFKQCHSVFTKHIMPLIGRLLSGDRTSYAYLAASANKFPSGQTLVTILEKEGFANVRVKSQFFGATSLYVAQRL